MLRRSPVQPADRIAGDPVTAGRLAAALILLLPAASDARTIAVFSHDGRAVETAIRQSKSGDTVLLSAGAYALTRSLSPKSGTRLLGAGQTKTTLRFTGAVPGAMIELSDRSHVMVRSLALDGASNPNAFWAIHAHGASHLQIRQVTIRNLVKNDGGPLGIAFSGDNPTHANGVTDSVIADCRFENIGVTSEWGGAVRLSWGSSRNTIVRNVVRNTGRGGIFGNDRSTDLVICGNTVTGSHGEGLGIEVWNGCDRSVIEDNRIDHWLSIGGDDFCAVRRNIVGDRSGTVKFIGIEVIGSDCVIAGNQVTGGQQIGLSVSDNAIKKRILWKDDTVQNCIQWGAQLQGDRTGLAEHYFYRCRFFNNRGVVGKSIYPNDSGHGFRINENARDLVLEECEFDDNAGLGIQVNGAPQAPVENLLFDRCRIAGNGSAAARFWPGITGLQWKNCTVSGNRDNTLPAERPLPGAAPVVTVEIPPVARSRMASYRANAATHPIQVLWDFGDGIPSNQMAPRHTYSRPGRYEVTLVAWDNHGRAVRKTGTVQVTR